MDFLVDKFVSVDHIVFSSNYIQSELAVSKVCLVCCSFGFHFRLTSKPTEGEGGGGGWRFFHSPFLLQNINIFALLKREDENF